MGLELSETQTNVVILIIVIVFFTIMHFLTKSFVSALKKTTGLHPYYVLFIYLLSGTIGSFFFLEVPGGNSTENPPVFIALYEGLVNDPMGTILNLSIIFLFFTIAAIIPFSIILIFSVMYQKAQGKYNFRFKKETDESNFKD